VLDGKLRGEECLHFVFHDILKNKSLLVDDGE
jgi:hypothetical protein